ncbi:hypothetical protein ACJQWK_04656 [Exserohilum turcicum]|uniref:Uncharacterized protein n=1 Tax=Exserohilum turcicum (strain 28A) TaxID=671987 RepID=R0IAT1_EXST2|nr:uncharacterized protein SETTUDRAFT_22408 [Exserohilum turcica Et28A]EOA82416.1 hypothetical protein SETTUDRAFT_22408 [Exserohilum turcica Et28A]
MKHGLPVFHWKTYIVGFPTSVEERQLGEEIYFQITQSYYDTGLGFNIAPAGLSIQSANKLSPDKSKQLRSIRNDSKTYQDQIQAEVNTSLPKYKEFADLPHQTAQESLRLQTRYEELLREEASKAPISDADVRDCLAMMDEAQRLID